MRPPLAGDHVAHLAQLVHEVLGVEAAGRVDDHHVVPARPGGLDRVEGHRARVGSARRARARGRLAPPRSRAARPRPPGRCRLRRSARTAPAPAGGARRSCRSSVLPLPLTPTIRITAGLCVRLIVSPSARDVSASSSRSRRVRSSPPVRSPLALRLQPLDDLGRAGRSHVGVDQRPPAARRPRRRGSKIVAWSLVPSAWRASSTCCRAPWKNPPCPWPSAPALGSSSGAGSAVKSSLQVRATAAAAYETPTAAPRGGRRSHRCSRPCRTPSCPASRRRDLHAPHVDVP